MIITAKTTDSIILIPNIHTVDLLTPEWSNTPIPATNTPSMDDKLYNKNTGPSIA